VTIATGGAVVPFSLPGVDGQEYGPREGAISAVVFWANHCPYVQAWEERLNRIARENPDVVIVAVGANDPERVPEDGPDAMRQRARDRDYAFAYVHDASQEVARAYGAERTPEVFLFDSGGRLAYHGAIDDAWEEENVTAHYLTDAIELIRHGGLVQPAETPPVGCSIKWRDS
jgi:thiol-disulfide isomerase/thioredoxin